MKFYNEYLTNQLSISDEQLTKMIETICDYYWNFKCEIRCFRNNRLKRSLGYFKYTNKSLNPLYINISNEVLTQNYKLETLINILKHECTHYYLFTKGLPHSDNDFTFLNELKRIKSNPTQTIKGKESGYYCKCSKCGKTVYLGKTEKSVKSINQYISRCCKAKLINPYFKENNNFIDKTENPYEPELMKKIYNILNINTYEEIAATSDRKQLNDIVIPNKFGKIKKEQVYQAMEKCFKTNDKEHLYNIINYHKELYLEIANMERLSKKRAIFYKSIL